MQNESAGSGEKTHLSDSAEDKRLPFDRLVPAGRGFVMHVLRNYQRDPDVDIRKADRRSRSS
jgi:hypothetical protein